MPDRPATPPRVLLASLAPMARLGMTRVLGENCAVVLAGDGDGAVVADAGRLRPDVVVLGRDAAPVDGLCARIRAAAPAAKVILWPADEDEMEVLDPGDVAPRRVTSPLSAALLGELGCVERTTERT